MKIRIAQCLCPKRHAILGLAVNDPSNTDAEVLEMLRAAIVVLISGPNSSRESIGLPTMEKNPNPWCALCGAKWADWIYEVCWSKEFSTWDEAVAVLKDLETWQQISQTLAHLLGVSYDAQQKRSMN